MACGLYKANRKSILDSYLTSIGHGVSGQLLRMVSR
jgi:hypothetical protein